MTRFKKHTRLGWQWLMGGWRLLLRDPWLLMGMGLCSALLVTVLSLIPLLGGSLIAFIAPMVLASLYLAIDRLSRLNMPLPVNLRRAAMKQSPRELFLVFADERRVVPIVIVSLYSMVVSLVTNSFLWLIAGSAWTKPLSALSAPGVASVLVAMVVSLILYFFLAISIVYALPRTFLRGKPLFPEMARSVRAGWHYVFALATVLGVLLVPALIGTIISGRSAWVASIVMLFVNTVAVPWVACSLYCSYRMLYQPRPEPAR